MYAQIRTYPTPEFGVDVPVRDKERRQEGKILEVMMMCFSIHSLTTTQKYTMSYDSLGRILINDT